MASKSKSTLSDAPPVHKASPATPRIAKLVRTPSKSDGTTPSPGQIPRLSIDRSPKPVATRTPMSRATARAATPPDRPQSRLFKPSEMQAQITAAEEDLKKAKEKLLTVEKEKTQALDDLMEAKKFVDEAEVRLQEAMAAQKRAEESLEIEKFRAIEIEQAGIEAAMKNDEVWKKEIEEVRCQHAADIAALLSTSEELQRVKQELAMITDAKNQALCHADDATKIAEIHAEKVEILSAELTRLKGLLELKAEAEAKNEGEAVAELKLELDSLKQELEKAKGLEEKLAENEDACGKLNTELDSARNNVSELKLELDSIKKELEEANGSMKELVEKAESRDKLILELEIAEKNVMELKSELDSLKQELEEASSYKDNLAQKAESCDKLSIELEAADKNAIELKSELEALKQELDQAKSFEEKLAQRDEAYEQLHVELEAVRMAESYARNMLEEWKTRTDELELQVKESSRLERSASESVESIMKQLGENSDLLHEAECEIVSLKEKVSLLEISLKRQMVDLEESEQRLKKAKEEAAGAANMIESLKSELEAVKDIKVQALENEKLAAASVEELLEEKNKLINELEASKEEDEKSKKAMESLASALHEVSAEARMAKETLLSSQAEHESFESQIEDMKLVLKATNEKYQSLVDAAKRESDDLTSSMEQSKMLFETQIEDMRLVLKATNEKYECLLDEAKHEIEELTNGIELVKTDHQNSKSEWEQKVLEATEAAEAEKSALRASVKEYETMLGDTKSEIEHLTKTTDQLKMEYESAKSEWEQKELQLVNCVKASEEEKSSMKESDGKYETMLETTKQEIKHLTSVVEMTKTEHENSRDEWEQKEMQLVNSMKRSEEEKSSMEKEIMRLVNLLRETEEKAHSAKEEGSQLRTSLKDAKYEATHFKEALDDFKSSLLDKENQLQTLSQENEKLRVAECTNIQKIEELSRLLEEAATGKKQNKDNGEISDTEKDYDLLPRVVEFSEENGHRSEDNISNGKHKVENVPQLTEQHPDEGSNDFSFDQPQPVHFGGLRLDDVNGQHPKAMTAGVESKVVEEEGAEESEPKMWESCKIEGRDFSMDRGEQDSVDDDMDSKADRGEGFEHMNDLLPSESNRSSPSSGQEQKKKKPLYRKFGNLLKKGIGNQK